MGQIVGFLFHHLMTSSNMSYALHYYFFLFCIVKLRILYRYILWCQSQTARVALSLSNSNLDGLKEHALVIHDWSQVCYTVDNSILLSMFNPGLAHTSIMNRFAWKLCTNDYMSIYLHSIVLMVVLMLFSTPPCVYSVCRSCTCRRTAWRCWGSRHWWACPLWLCWT